MKTFAKLFAVLAFLAVGFTACSDDDDDAQVTINLDKNEWASGAAVTGKIVSDNDLKTVTLTRSGQTVVGWPITSFKEGAVVGSNGSYTIRIEGLSDGAYAMRATDKDGKEDNRSFTVKSDEPGPGPGEDSTVLDAPANFEWKRVGSNTATGVGAFGLKWPQNNSKATYAWIEKATATKLVKLSSGNWTSITTKEALKAAVDAATDMGTYKGISTTAGNDYDEVLGVINSGTYYMIHITKADVDTGNGTTVTITGQSKK